MDGRLSVYVYSGDPVFQVGIASLLRGLPDLDVLSDAEIDSAQVAIVATDEIDEEAGRAVRAIQRNGCPRVVVVAGTVDPASVMIAVEAGACGLLRRREASRERLLAAVRAAANGDGTVPPDLLGRLLEQVGRLQREVLAPRGISVGGLSSRERDVLRMIADGADTSEIAARLAYSERTVKNVVHDLVNRLQVRNRSHAVAYAVREGLI
jgi:DNA-binding NarL/FixJ family response regulator